MDVWMITITRATTSGPTVAASATVTVASATAMMVRMVDVVVLLPVAMPAMATATIARIDVLLAAMIAAAVWRIVSK